MKRWRGILVAVVLLSCVFLTLQLGSCIVSRIKVALNRHEGAVPLFSEWRLTDMGWRTPVNDTRDDCGNLLLIDRARNTLCLIVGDYGSHYSVENSLEIAYVRFPSGSEWGIPAERDTFFAATRGARLEKCTLFHGAAEQVADQVGPHRIAPADLVSLLIESLGTDSAAAKLLNKARLSTRPEQESEGIGAENWVAPWNRSGTQ